MKHERPAWMPEAEVAENLIRFLPRLARNYYRYGRKAARKKAAADTLHQFRLRTKHFRYLLELFAPFYGKRLARPLESLRRLQTLLGELNDYTVTRQMVPPDMPDADRLHAHLDALEKERRAEFRSFWRETFDADGAQEKWEAMLAAPSRNPALKRESRQSPPRPRP